jgi:PAT family beta-lactamase induction signal transducer AmpG
MIVKKTLHKEKKNKGGAWTWIPTLYFAEGLPYVIVITLSVIMYKRLGISNADIALYTSWLYLPWVIKPFWSPLIDLIRTKRFWIVAMQLVIGAGMAGVALTIPAPDFFRFTLLFFWLIAFSSATHDIAADGFYMHALDEGEQSFFVGIRSTFYRFAIIFGQGILVILAGHLESTLTVSPAEIRVISSPEKFFENTLIIDSSSVKPMEGQLRVIAQPDTLEISTKPQTKQTVDFYVNFVRKMNIINGFSKTDVVVPDTADSMEPVGNIGIVKFMLSNKPGDDEEIVVNLNYHEGDKNFNVIAGNKLVFNSSNWNKPAFALVQLEPYVNEKTEAVFKLEPVKVPLAWIITFGLLAALFFIFFVYHNYLLPEPKTDKPVLSAGFQKITSEFFRTFFRFFEKRKIVWIIAFLLLYRLGEAQLVKMVGPFFLDPKSAGGLGLSTSDVGLIYGTVGVAALVIGGIIGGILISKHGLKKLLFTMLVAMNIPNIAYVYLAYAQPDQIWIVYLCVIIEQFGYGFGFTAYMMYMIYVSDGQYKASHYAITTGFMALGMMIPGMFSGIIQEAVGYQLFFVWVCIAAIPAFIAAKLIPLNPAFGKKDRK